MVPAQVNYMSHWLLAHELLLAPEQNKVSPECNHAHDNFVDSAPCVAMFHAIT
jgi:hypothetical protein